MPAELEIEATAEESTQRRYQCNDRRMTQLSQMKTNFRSGASSPMRSRQKTSLGYDPSSRQPKAELQQDKVDEAAIIEEIRRKGRRIREMLASQSRTAASTPSGIAPSMTPPKFGRAVTPMRASGGSEVRSDDFLRSPIRNLAKSFARSAADVDKWSNQIHVSSRSSDASTATPSQASARTPAASPAVSARSAKASAAGTPPISGRPHKASGPAPNHKQECASGPRCRALEETSKKDRCTPFTSPTACANLGGSPNASMLDDSPSTPRLKGRCGSPTTPKFNGSPSSTGLARSPSVKKQSGSPCANRLGTSASMRSLDGSPASLQLSRNQSHLKLGGRVSTAKLFGSLRAGASNQPVSGSPSRESTTVHQDRSPAATNLMKDLGCEDLHQSFSQHLLPISGSTPLRERPAEAACSPTMTVNTAELQDKLAEAARSGDSDTAQQCLAELPAGAPVCAKDADGWTSLHYAASEGHLEVCRLLLEARGDANVNLPDFSTPIMLAVEEGNIPIAQLLLKHGARLRSKDEAGFTVMDRCAPAALNEFTKSVQQYM